MTAANRWEFWIDVGGTFTDCIARAPDGCLVRHKLLSSGVTKGRVAAGSTADLVFDPARTADPTDFWTDHTLYLYDESGGMLAASRVAAFDRGSGTLELSRPLTVEPRPGQSYELTAGLEAPIAAIRYILGLTLSRPVPPVTVRLGTTRGTNALITRRGARTALVTTRGFGDILRIGYQNRPRLFELAIRKRPPLCEAVVEIDERITPTGEVLTAPDEAATGGLLGEVQKLGIESLAICLLNAYAQPRHELLVERLAREAGFTEISTSHRVAPLVKLVSRGDTTAVDGYLNPVLRGYVAGLRVALGETGASSLRLLTSAGGLAEADHFLGKDSILSGPAGGVVGFSRVAGAAGFERAIGFDMGGTSTDVARWDGRYELEYEAEKAGVRIVAPMLAIETVAAGGGSICRFDGVKLAVGPASAGADPGPACYGRGGPLAVTDVNFYLGKILPEHFPFPLDRTAVERRLGELCMEVAAATGTRYSLNELAEGLLQVANANMVKAIRTISIARGYDPRDYVLVAFGGAAPQHACSVARELGIGQILNHADGGILSALGIGLADVVRHRAHGVYRPYSEEEVKSLRDTLAELAAQAREEVEAEGVPRERIETHYSLDLRYTGLETAINVPQPEAGTYAEAYAARHEQLFGYHSPERAMEIVAARVEVIGRTAEAPPMAERAARRQPPAAKAAAGKTTLVFDGQVYAAEINRREDLNPGDTIDGPAIIVEQVSTTVIDPDWRAEVLTDGTLQITDFVHSPAAATNAPPAAIPTSPDPIQLEIFNNQFAGIAEQMGVTLQSTASSVNVKERLDFSCALFTAAGELAVNAPHIPVHLGAMGETVRHVLADNPRLQPGDVVVTNDPYRGGSHLPDVTVVTPVFSSAGELRFFTASRAHHAEIGGIAPGSMPPFSQNLAEEGVLIRNFLLIEGGRSRLAELRELLTGAPYPSRAVDDNLADIEAQVAANRQGARDLEALSGRQTWHLVEAYMRFIQQAAETKMRAALAALPDGRHEFLDHLDDGSPIRVAFTIAGDSAVIDFKGSGPVLPGNLNANRAIVTAAVMYVLRCLIEEDIPLNQGVLAPVEILLPVCLLNPPEGPRPEDCAAVAGGNVETSQRVVDVLLGALGAAAASQGTMNNLLFGDERFGYYETICGGSGATPRAAGADAVHTHMTNTRLTDPEILERRYPVRVREFSIRRGSGGGGQRRGGDGVVRQIEFLAPLDVSIVSQRRGPCAPFGLAGGASGALGLNTLVRADGTQEELSGTAQFRAEPGDVLTIETPGGGGYGAEKKWNHR